MGKVNKVLASAINILTAEQKFILEEFSKNLSLKNNFYFTGGTALGAFYLQHRLSEDLDFFSEKQFDDAQIVLFIKRISLKLNTESKFTKVYETRIFELFKKNKLIIKVDFNYYPFERIEQGKNIEGYTVDSLFDIAVNKLLTINQRTDVKDFVDLYFLFREFTLWDLMEGVRRKFGIEIDPILAAADMLKVEGFEDMPRMIKPLTLEQLKTFFKKKAKELGKTLVE